MRLLGNIIGDKRIATDIFLSFIFRGSSAVCALLLVPITLSFLDKSLYGLWMTILALLNWTTVFDLGINNGLRTKLIYAFAKKDKILAQKEVTTTYNIMSLFCVSVILILLLINYWIDWNQLFRYPGIHLGKIIVISLVFYVFKLVTDLINAVLLADQKTWLFNFIFFLANFLSLIAVLILKRFEITQKLFLLSLLLTAIPLGVGLGANIAFFSTKYRLIRPLVFRIHSELIKPTISQGFRFFILQLSILIIFSTDNFIIIRLFSASDVAVYNICYKLFSVFTIAWTVLISPFWAAFGDAFHKQDLSWIRKQVKRLLSFWLLLNLALIIVVWRADDIYRLWVGDQIIVPFSLNMATAAFISIFSLSNIFIYFINGIGKLQVQLITSVATGIINIPLSIFLAQNWGMGTTGVMVATCICLGANPVVSYLQYRKLMSGRAKGIWNR